MKHHTRPIGRLAPSPTGHLHLGHARTFLCAYWSIRAREGELVLRLEDLDTERARLEHADEARRDLEWLGIDWDRCRLQSEGVDRMRDVALDWVRRGLAYPCVCSRGDVRTALSAPHGPVSSVYPGTCRGRFSELAEAEATGKGPGVRFLTPQGDVAFDDAFAGRQERDPATEVGDFLILRRDGRPSYHLAVVLDDIQDGVTEVLRGDDLLQSTFAHLVLYDAAQETPPAYCHVPLVVDEQGRLAKRAPRFTLSTLRQAGVDARAVVSWVASSVGMESDTFALAPELTTRFELSAVPREEAFAPEHLRCDKAYTSPA